MTQTKISQLTADAAPSLDDLICTVNDPAGTPASRKVTLSALLALLKTNLALDDLSDVSVSGASDGEVLKLSGGTWSGGADATGSGSATSLTLTATKTANYTAAAGELVVVDASAGSVTVTLPGSPSAGDHCGAVLLADGISSDYAVTVDGNGGTLTGGSTDNKLYLAGDLLTFRWTGSAWLCTGRTLAAHHCTLGKNVEQQITYAAFGQITFDTLRGGVGHLDDLANYRIVVKRPGCYSLSVYVQSQLMADNASLLAALYVNGTVICAAKQLGGGTQAIDAQSVMTNYLLAAGDLVTAWFYTSFNSASNKTYASASGQPRLELKELL